MIEDSALTFKKKFYFDRLPFTFSIILFILSTRFICELLNLKRLTLLSFSVIIFLLLFSMIPSNPALTLNNLLSSMHASSEPFVRQGLLHSNQLIGEFIHSVSNESEYVYVVHPYSEIISVFSDRRTCGNLVKFF